MKTEPEEKTTELATIDPQSRPLPAAAKPTTERALVMSKALEEDTEQRDLVKRYVARHMQKDVDYGVIPGTQKPTLLKPGAEKLTDLFRCTAAYKIIEKIEDWDKGLFHYVFRVRISSRETGGLLAEGYGSANSKEGRYRWRNAGRKCPQCGKETIIQGKPEYGGGYICFAKKGGCGAKFSKGDQSIEGQQIGKVENDDIFTMANTILKMAKKRALVDGAIALARCSDIFTQDIEDFADHDNSEVVPPPPPAPPRATERPPVQNDAARAAHKKEIEKNLLGKKDNDDKALNTVLASIRGARTLADLVACQDAAQSLEPEAKATARKVYSERRDQLRDAEKKYEAAVKITQAEVNAVTPADIERAARLAREEFEREDAAAIDRRDSWTKQNREKALALNEQYKKKYGNTPREPGCDDDLDYGPPPMTDDEINKSTQYK